MASQPRRRLTSRRRRITSLGYRRPGSWGLESWRACEALHRTRSCVWPGAGLGHRSPAVATTQGKTWGALTASPTSRSDVAEWGNGQTACRRKPSSYRCQIEANLDACIHLFRSQPRDRWASVFADRCLPEANGSVKPEEVAHVVAFVLRVGGRVRQMVHGRSKGWKACLDVLPDMSATARTAAKSNHLRDFPATFSHRFLRPCNSEWWCCQVFRITMACQAWLAGVGHHQSFSAAVSEDRRILTGLPANRVKIVHDWTRMHCKTCQ